MRSYHILTIDCYILSTLRSVVHCSGCPKSIAQRNIGYLQCPGQTRPLAHVGAQPRCHVACHAPCHDCHDCHTMSHTQVWPHDDVTVYSDSSVYYTDTDNIQQQANNNNNFSSRLVMKVIVNTVKKVSRTWKNLKGYIPKVFFNSSRILNIKQILGIYDKT